MAFDDGVKTVSGSVAHTDDAATKVPFVSVKCVIEPTLTGVSEVSATQTGENLFDKAAVIDNTWIVVNDTTTESAVGYRTSGYIPVKANTKYFVSAKSSNRSAYYDRNKNGIAYFSFSGGASFTCLYDGYIRITIKNDIDLDTFIVNEGNTAILYEPYNGTQYNVELPKSESLADFASNINSTTYNVNVEDIGNGGIRFYGTPSATYLNLTTIFDWSFSANKTFTLSRSVSRGYRCYVRIQFTDNSTTNVIIENNATSVSYTPTKDIKNIRLDVSGLSTSTTYDERIYVMIQEGSASTPYFYLGGSVDIITGDGEETYAKDSLGSIYLSTFNSDYIGYESSTAYFGGHPSVWLRNWHYQDAKARQTGGIGCLCNYFPVSMHNTSIFASQYRIYFDVDGKNISSVSDFIDYVENIEQNGDSLDIVYELATPLTYTITPREIETVGNVNNVYCNTGNTEVTYYDNAHGFSEVTVNKNGVSQTAYLHKVIYGGQADVVKGTCEQDWSDTWTWTSGMSGVSVNNKGVCYINKSDVITVNASNQTTLVGCKCSDTSFESRTWAGLQSSSTNGCACVYGNGVAIRIQGYTTKDEYEAYLAEHPLKFIYMLKEPITFSFPPISMSTDDGENTLFANEGDSAITYRKAVD